MISYSLAELKTVYSSYGRFGGGVDVLELMQMVKRCCKWVQFSFSTVYTFLDKIVRMIDSEKSFHTGIIFHGYHYIRISVLTDPKCAPLFDIIVKTSIWDDDIFPIS